jgi:adhesin/invasin
MSRTRLLLLLGSAAAALWACQEFVAPRVEGRLARRIQINVGQFSVNQGDTLRLTAALFDQTNTAYTTVPAGLSLVWASSAPAIMTVNQTGLVTGVTPGQADISVSCTVDAGTLTISATGTVVPTGPQVATLLIVAGDSQTVTAGAPVPVAPTVEALDASGNRVPGVTVTFAVASGGGGITGPMVVTNALGIARVGSWTLGTSAGANTLTATVPGTGIAGNPATFVATGVAGPAAQIAAGAGNNQSALEGTAVAVPPAVVVTDQYGNPVRGVVVTFTVASGGGSVTGASPTTNAGGIAAVGSWTLGATPGANTLTATATGSAITGNPVTFTATATGAVPTQIAVNAGNNQSSTVGLSVPIPPSVIVRDASNNPVAGVTVTFAVASGGGVVSGPSQTTNTGGIAVVGAWNLGTTPGTNTLTATATGSGITGNPVTFTATATALPSQIAVNAGNNQSATVGLSVPVAPSVIVRDASNNPVAGVAVTFAVASGGGAVTGASQTTNASGIATVGGWGLGTTAGANTLTATATGSGITGNPVTFTATGTAGAAYVVGVSAGNNQSASPGSAVPVPPAVFAHDFWGNAVPGLAVTFAVASGGGSITGASQTTGANGVATVGSWTLGTTAGTNTLTATVTGSGLLGNPVTFTATGGGTSGTVRKFLGGASLCLNGADWSCAANWNPAGVPTASDSVIIASGALYPPGLTANAVAGAVVISGLELSLNGHTLTVARGFSTTGNGFLRMTNALDSLVVGGDATFNGGSEFNQLLTGILVAHGGVLQSNGAPMAFSPSGSFATALVGGGTHNLQIVDIYSNFQNLDVSQTTGTVNMLSPLILNGYLVDTGTVVDTVLGSGNHLTAQNVIVTGRLTLDNTQLVIQAQAGGIGTFNNVTFQNYGSGEIMLQVQSYGSYTFSGLTFPTSAPLSGYYVSAVSSGGIPLSLTIHSNLTPSFAQTYTQAGTGATVTWLSP